jgi:long-chain fatty acid transport protein
VVGFPDPFYLPEKRIERHFKNAYAVRLGGEYIIGVDEDWSVILRAGIGFETSAIPPEHMSVLTVDIPKVTGSLGFGLGYRDWRFDIVGAYIGGPSVEVPPDEAQGQILNPVEANISRPHAVNGGSYSARAVVLGIGLKVNFDEVAPLFGDPPAAEGEGEAGGEAKTKAPKEPNDEDADDQQADDEDADDEVGSDAG